MDTEKLVKIILVTTVLVIALAWAGGALAKSGTGLVDTSTSLLDRLFNRDKVVVSGNYDEEAIPADGWFPFIGDSEFEIYIMEFDEDEQECDKKGKYFNIEKQDVGWELSYVDFPMSWEVKEGIELLQIVGHNQIHGTLKLNSGYYTKKIGYETWWKQDEDDIRYCTLEGGQDEKPFTPEEMVYEIKVHFDEEKGITKNKDIITG